MKSKRQPSASRRKSSEGIYEVITGATSGRFTTNSQCPGVYQLVTVADKIKGPIVTDLVVGAIRLVLCELEERIDVEGWSKPLNFLYEDARCRCYKVDHT